MLLETSRGSAVRSVAFRVEFSSTCQARLKDGRIVGDHDRSHVRAFADALEVLDFEEDGIEAVWKIEVVNFPAFIVVNNKGSDFFKEFM